MQKINDVLCEAKSNACGTGRSLYDEGYKHNINAEFALAVFLKVARLESYHAIQVRMYPFHKSWQDSYKAWYETIRVRILSAQVSQDLVLL